MTTSYDCIVVGGGVIGTAVAYYTAAKGASVLLLERHSIAGGTSGACDGFVILQSKSPGPHLDMALKSAALYSQLADQLAFDVEYRLTGGMIIIENETQAELMASLVKRQQEHGLAVELLSSSQARQREAMLSEGIWGAAYSPQDGQVNPILVAQGLAYGAKRRGAHIRQHTTGNQVLVDKGRVVGVATDQGTFYSPYVVNACGVWASELVRPLGIDLPIRPRRGQLLVTEPLPPCIRHVLLCACYLTAKHQLASSQSEHHHRLGVGLAVEQAVNGSLLLGSTREYVGFDKRTTREGIRAVASHVRQLLPRLEAVNVIRTFAGLRPATPTGMPIIGPAPEYRGLIIAAGHEGDGIALAPVTGQMVAEYIV